MCPVNEATDVYSGRNKLEELNLTCKQSEETTSPLSPATTQGGGWCVDSAAGRELEELDLARLFTAEIPTSNSRPTAESCGAMRCGVESSAMQCSAVQCGAFAFRLRLRLLLHAKPPPFIGRTPARYRYRYLRKYWYSLVRNDDPEASLFPQICICQDLSQSLIPVNQRRTTYRS